MTLSPIFIGILLIICATAFAVYHILRMPRKDRPLSIVFFLVPIIIGITVMGLLKIF